ncbi:MAG TPA: hypothetical protein VGE97_03505 [Nitrososphaera sp.]|jgi:hypothetical protein
MAGQQMNVTISATDQMSPTLKSIITNLQALTNELKIVDSGITTVQGKFRAQSFGATNLFPTQQVTAFSASLNQLGIDFNKVQTTVTPTVTKFQQFGQVLLQNGTAFGVAGASAFGLFNAIDNLEKVQLKAETATLRASTANTALAVAEQRLAEAKASGSATTGELAILEQRVADARERVSVTTERASIFQQDYNEALAGLALQIGPQTIALGGSMVQMFTQLNNTVGKTKAFENLTSGLAGFLPGMTKATTETQKLTGALGQMSVTTKTAGSSLTAMAAEFGPFGIAIAAAVAQVIAFADAWTTATEQIEANKIALATGKAFDFTGTFEEIKKTMNVTGFQGGLFSLLGGNKLIDDTIKSIKDDLGRRDAAAEILQPVIDTLGEQPAGFESQIKAKMAWLGRAFANPNNWIDADTKANSSKVVAGVIDEILTLSAQGMAAKPLDVQGFFGDMAKGAQDAQPFIDKWSASVANGSVTVKELNPLIKAYGEELVKSGESTVTANAAMEKINTVLTDIQPSTVSFSEALKKVNKDMETSAEESAKMYVAQTKQAEALKATTTAFAGVDAAQSTSLGQQQAFNDIIVAGITGMQQQEIGLRKMADANAVSTQVTRDAISAQAEMIISLTDIGAIYDESTTSFLALTKARVDGVTAAQSIVTSAELEATTMEATTKALQDYMVASEGLVVPPGIELTLEQLTALQKEFAATGSFAEGLANIVAAQVAPAFQDLSEVFHAEDWKAFKDAFKDLNFGDLPKTIQGEFKEFDNMIRKINEDVGEMEDIFHQLQAMQFLDKLDVSTFTKGLNQIATEVERIGKLQKIDVSFITEFLQQVADTKDPANLQKYATIIGEIVTLSADGLGADELAQLKKDIDAINADPVTAVNDAFTAFNDIISTSSKNMDTLNAKFGTFNIADLQKAGGDTTKITSDTEKAQLQSRFTGIQPGGAGGERAPEVPGPVKATDFDSKKQAIIDEVNTMFTKTPIPPAIIPAPNTDAFTTGFAPVSTAIVGYQNSIAILQTPVVIPAPVTEGFTTAFAAVSTAIVGYQNARLILETPITVPPPIVAGFAEAFATINAPLAGFQAAKVILETPIIVPAPNTEAFVTAFNNINTPLAGFQNAKTILETPIVLPAPDTSAFTDAFSTLASDVIASLDEIRTFVEDDLTTALSDLVETATGDIADGIDEAAQTMIDSLQEVVDFLTDDMATAFEDMQSAAESAAEGAASAMDDIISAAEEATSAVEDITNALNNIPTRVDVTVFVGLEGPGVAFLAGGYHGIVDEPTLLVVGEAGAERVDVSPATGPASPLFIEGEGGRTGVTNPLLQKDFGPIGMPLPQYVPQMVTQPTTQPMYANISIPVYLDGRHIETRQSQRFIRDLGAIIS